MDGNLNFELEIYQTDDGGFLIQVRSGEFGGGTGNRRFVAIEREAAKARAIELIEEVFSAHSTAINTKSQ